MTKKTRIKASAAVFVPQSREQVTEAIRNIGVATREITRIEAAMNDELAAIRERYEAQALPLRDRVAYLNLGVQTWCEGHRDTLTQGGKVKTAAFPSGEVQWRMRPPSVGIRGVDSVLDALSRLGLNRFVRTKEEVNKEAILAEPEAVRGVAGITINQGEDFVVSPFETELSEA